MAEPVHETALGGRRLEEASVSIAEAPAMAMIDLRIGEGDAGGREAAAGALGSELPATPRTSASGGGGANAVTALWLSVDQWLVVGPAGRRAELLGALSSAMAGRHAAVTDLSEARTVIRLEGDGAREIVMKGAAADLMAPDFGPGSVRRMNFAGIAAMVHASDLGPDRLDLYVFRSHADYALRWLAVAARPGAALRLFTAAPPPPV